MKGESKPVEFKPIVLRPNGTSLSNPLAAICRKYTFARPVKPRKK